jgi:hypothetical protein
MKDASLNVHRTLDALALTFVHRLLRACSSLLCFLFIYL